LTHERWQILLLRTVQLKVLRSKECHIVVRVFKCTIKRENSEKNLSSVVSETAEAMGILRTSMRAGKLCLYGNKPNT
jgi:S-adenosylmethionine/arginine decarboxylase-like enzyme